MLLKVIPLLFGVVATAVVGVAFQSSPDPLNRALFDWGLLYIAGVVQPALWTLHNSRTLRKLGLTINRQTGVMACSPLIVGGVVLLISLSLIRVAAQGSLPP
jgi:hypothetical protein